MAESRVLHFILSVACLWTPTQTYLFQLCFYCPPPRFVLVHVFFFQQVMFRIYSQLSFLRHGQSTSIFLCEYVVHNILSGSSEELLVWNYLWPEYSHYVLKTLVEVGKVDKNLTALSFRRQHSEQYKRVGRTNL